MSNMEIFIPHDNNVEDSYMQPKIKSSILASSLPYHVIVIFHISEFHVKKCLEFNSALSTPTKGVILTKRGL